MSLNHNELLDLIPPHASEDLRQDLFVALADAEPASAEAAQIVRQRTIYRADWARRQDRIRGNELDADNLTTRAHEGQPVANLVLHLLNSLDPADRELVQLRMLQELPAAVVAARLRISQPTMRRRLEAALQKMREIAA